MLGAIAGDGIGSVFEWQNVKSTQFDLFNSRIDFTDDTVLTVAVADAILSGREYGASIKEYGLRYPNRGYGGFFRQWLQAGESKPYNSFGNGSAMRVSPVGFAFPSLREVLAEAEKSAAVTHNHPEGIKGAQAVASAIFLAKSGESRETMRKYLTEQFGYDLTKSVSEIRPTYSFNETCQGSVPQAITAFLESKDYEDAIRLAISLGGDSDTIACIAGGIAQAFYKTIPEFMTKEERRLLHPDLLAVVDLFKSKHGW